MVGVVTVVKSNGGQCTNEAAIDNERQLSSMTIVREHGGQHVVVVVASFIMSSSTHEDS